MLTGHLFNDDWGVLCKTGECARTEWYRRPCGRRDNVMLVTARVLRERLQKRVLHECLHLR